MLTEALHMFEHDGTYIVDMAYNGNLLAARRDAMTALKQRRREAKEAAKAQDPCDEIVTEAESALRLATSGRTAEVTDPSEGEAGSGAYPRRATHCGRGHDLTVPGNRYVYPNGIKSQCAVCREAGPARPKVGAVHARDTTASTPTQPADPAVTD